MNDMKLSRTKTLWNLFVVFFKAGTFTFAGGLAMLPVIERDLVDKNNMLPRDEFLEYATLAQTLPGIIAVNCASFVGRRVAGTLGMLAAVFGATISAFVIMLIATVLLQIIPKDGPVAGAFAGIRAASSAFVLTAAITLGRHNIKNIFAVIVAVLSFVFVLFLNTSALIVVLVAAVAGYLYQVMRAKIKKSEVEQ